MKLKWKLPSLPAKPFTLTIERDDRNLGIGKLLQQIRKMRGWTQDELADAVHIDRSSIAGIEAGRQPLTVEKLQAMVRALGMDLEVTITPKAPA
jgi:transcriptional regulator with XRE-family HTH domain